MQKILLQSLLLSGILRRFHRFQLKLEQGFRVLLYSVDSENLRLHRHHHLASDHQILRCLRQRLHLLLKRHNYVL